MSSNIAVVRVAVSFMVAYFHYPEKLVSYALHNQINFNRLFKATATIAGVGNGTLME